MRQQCVLRAGDAGELRGCAGGVLRHFVAKGDALSVRILLRLAVLNRHSLALCSRNVCVCCRLIRRGRSTTPGRGGGSTGDTPRAPTPIDSDRLLDALARHIRVSRATLAEVPADLLTEAVSDMGLGIAERVALTLALPKAKTDAQALQKHFAQEEAERHDPWRVPKARFDRQRAKLEEEFEVLKSVLLVFVSPPSCVPNSGVEVGRGESVCVKSPPVWLVAASFSEEVIRVNGQSLARNKV
jgi:hypothetical protein